MKRQGILALVWVLTIVSLVSLAMPAMAQKWGEVTDAEWNLQPPADFPEANAEVVFDMGRLTVTINGISLTQHVRMKVFTDAGAEDIGDVSIYYRDDDKLKNLKAQTITPDGKKHDVDSKAFFSKSIGDTRVKTFAFPNIVPGSIVEYRYEVFNERFGALDPWYFQTDLYTLKSSFTLVLAPGFTYTSLARNIPRREQEAVVEDNLTTKDRSFTWTRSNLAPITDEPYMSAVSDYRSALYCQLVSYVGQSQTYNFIKGWPDLGEVYSNMVDEYARKDKGLKEAVASVVDPNSTAQVDKARAIYDYICQNIKTKSDGSWFTHDKLETILIEKYGTSDEKNVLLTSMLKQAGIDAWPVLTSTRTHGVFKPELYQTSQFNHIMVYAVVDSIGTYMDASTRFCPYGSLPANSMTNGGLLLDGKKSEIVRVFTNLPTCYRVDATNISIDSIGVAHCSTAVALTGYFNSLYGSLYEQLEPEEFIKTRFVDKASDDYDLGQYSFEFDTTSNRCKLVVDYTSRDITETLDQNILITPVIYYLKTNPFKLKRRDFPVDFGFPFTYQTILNIRCTGDIPAIQVPIDTALQIPGASYQRQVTKDGNIVKIETKLVVDNASFTPSDYSHLRLFFATLEDLNQQQVIFSGAKQ